ncbi:MAG TPA: ribonucleoside triphosphate reductase, partial [Candidatus Paceibacterota bacterium]|nr:ribonucleoside triphosphate reductase [Candidatus Paceibacterota bacterium]
MKNKILKVQKRDGSIVDFDEKRIQEAIYKALTATGQGDGKESKKLTEKVIELLNRRFKTDEIPHVEQIQDIVEEVLILEGLTETAKAYILYREQRRRIRESVALVDESIEMVDKYIGEIDWQVHENANMTYSLQGLNQYIIAQVEKKYWLNKIYPKEIREAARNEDLHIHNLETLAPYCMGWDLMGLLLKGFGGVPGKVESLPPKHFRTALGQLVNFLFTLQGETAGANAVSNLDTLLAPFIRYDHLSPKEVKQALQEFLFNCMVPTRVGFQTPFLNVSLDIKPPQFLANQSVIIGGQPQKETYGEFQEEMDLFNKTFYEVMLEGDAKGRPFTFPIPTVSITKDFDWDNPALDPMWEATAKYGINYFSNFVNSDMKPEDFRSMCCRLRLDNRELYKRGGGLFGAAPLTG